MKLLSIVNFKSCAKLTLDQFTSKVSEHYLTTSTSTNTNE